MREEIKKTLRIAKVMSYLRMLEINPFCLYHEESSSCEKSKELYRLKGLYDSEYILCKNMLIRDKKGKNFYLLITDYKKQVDFHELKKQLNTSTLVFATCDNINNLIDSEPGSISLFSVLNDIDNKVNILLDESIFEKKYLAFHPNNNSATLFINQNDVFTFLRSLNKQYHIGSFISDEKVKKLNIIT